MEATEPVFVDTSALYALLDRDDDHHPEARAIWEHMLAAKQLLLTHSYVLVETLALVHRRLGPLAVRAVHHDVVPLLEVVWVDEHLHQRAAEAFVASSTRSGSLVDRVSFAVMRRHGLRQVFAFDDDFRDEGFELLTT